MSDLFFPQYITNRRTLANQMHDGAWPVLCILLAYLGYIVFLCEVGCQDEASEPI